MDFARSSDPAVQAQLDRLATLSPGGDRLGLDRITRLLDRLGKPQDRLPPVFHVAGTNGKGSACAFLRAILEAAGLKVHLFTSPHLVRFNERIRLAGKLIEDEALAALLSEVLDSSEGIEPSFFEVTTAAAFLAFARGPADACVVEVGLGGRLDATNVIDTPLVCGIAGLGLDHRQWLGRTLAKIAAEKAAIAKCGVPLVTQRYPPQAARQILEVAERVGAPWIGRGALWQSRIIRDSIRYRDRHGALKLPLPRLAGRHQADNAALAVAMLRHQDRFAIPEAAMADGIRSAQWPARLQKLGAGPLTRRLPKGSELWIDGGHNGAAARLVADHARRALGGDGLPLVILFASLSSKDPKAMLQPFAGLAEEVHTLPIPDHEHRPPDELAALASSLGFRATANAGIEQALGRVALPSRVLLFGSLYLAGDALEANGEVPY
ncbi:MAG TPA: folylpolyglutamate synthase/dihydrofolate synthase family protein [Sphingomicrobium sp.]|nr:folylpolyglutamate synthase/dihydrofolate synthase family protein [Sphingomicrobium sp.]